MDWRKEIEILLDWPSQSPDLNPMNTFGMSLKGGKKRPKNATELEIAPKEEWSLISPKMNSNLIESMPKRLEACIPNN